MRLLQNSGFPTNGKGTSSTPAVKSSKWVRASAPQVRRARDWLFRKLFSR